MNPRKVYGCLNFKKSTFFIFENVPILTEKKTLNIFLQTEMISYFKKRKFGENYDRNKKNT